MLDDVTSVALQVAIAGLGKREQVTANNIANLETPNFTASHVSFEQSLADAINTGTPQDTKFSVNPTSDPAGINGNNVTLESEITDATKTTLEQQLLTQITSARFAQLNTVLKV